MAVISGRGSSHALYGLESPGQDTDLWLICGYSSLMQADAGRGVVAAGVSRTASRELGSPFQQPTSGGATSYGCFDKNESIRN